MAAVAIKAVSAVAKKEALTVKVAAMAEMLGAMAALEAATAA